MKKLYGYNGELEKRIERLDAANENPIVSDILSEQLNINGELPFGKAMLKVMSYMFDIKEEVWDKPCNSLVEEDLSGFFKIFASDLVTFVAE